MCLLRGLVLGSLEHSFPGEIEAISAIQVSLEAFQAMRPVIAPLQGEASFPRIVVSLQFLSNALQFSHTPLFNLREPLVEWFALSLTEVVLTAEQVTSSETEAMNARLALVVA
jgi:hypothetical protein